MTTTRASRTALRGRPYPCQLFLGQGYAFICWFAGHHGHDLLEVSKASFYVLVRSVTARRGKRKIRKKAENGFHFGRARGPLFSTGASKVHCKLASAQSLHGLPSTTKYKLRSERSNRQHATSRLTTTGLSLPTSVAASPYRRGRRMLGRAGRSCRTLLLC